MKIPVVGSLWFAERIESMNAPTVASMILSWMRAQSFGPSRVLSHLWDTSRPPVILALILLTAVAMDPAAAQTAVEWDPGREQVTRAELLELLEGLERQAASTAYSGRLRDEARRNMGMIQRRLEEGDFQVGDRIVLEVQGEPAMSDTLVVRSGRTVDVPVVGSLSLEGVLRSELQQTMEDHIGNYLRDPTIRTQALIRVSILGLVGSPGFYVFPADLPVTDILMRAGGPGADANLSNMRVERGNVRIWEGEALETAMIQGRTLDQMNIQAGDRIVVPPGGAVRDGWGTFRLVTFTIGSIGSIVWGVSRIFGGRRR
jgi:protein involved in polysaccharide export with SLBB domain